jgi:transposase-like protein
VLNRAQYPSDVIALVVLWRLRDRLTLRDLAEMFLLRGIAFSPEAAWGWEAKLAPALASELRRRRRGGGSNGRTSCHVAEIHLKVRGRWCYLYRAIDRNGDLVGTVLSEHRDMAAAKAFFCSAKSVTSIVPDKVTMDGHGSYPGRSAQRWAGGSPTASASSRTTGSSGITGASKAPSDVCGGGGEELHLS